jgi:hypothetical protein
VLVTPARVVVDVEHAAAAPRQEEEPREPDRVSHGTLSFRVVAPPAADQSTVRLGAAIRGVNVEAQAPLHACKG